MMNTEKAFSEDVRSRLWQDPFEVVEEHRNKQPSQQVVSSHSELPAEILYINDRNQSERIFLKNTKNSDYGKNVLIQPAASDDKHAYEYGREPVTVCLDKEKTSSYSNSEAITHSIEELKCEIKIETKNHKQDLHVLAVMVPGGPYAEDKEWRLRSRYAVIAALTELGYIPNDPEHIDFVDFDRTCKATLRELRDVKPSQKSEYTELKKKTHFCHMGSFMPYEWFKNDSDETILLLWLNNSEFVNTDNKTPLKMLGFLKSEILFSDNAKHSFNIIGPFGSGALDAMYREVNTLEPMVTPYREVMTPPETEGIGNVFDYLFPPEESDSDYYKALEGSSFYVAAATVNFDGIYAKWRNNKAWLDEKIIRTISTQDKLADLLLCELALRGVTPYHAGHDETLSKNCSKKLSGEFKLEKSDSPHHIVLIGERDTYYSQKLTDSFLDAIKKFDVKESVKTPWIHTYSYLRGLDGITYEHSSNQKEEKNKKKESQANKLNDTETREQKERPVGPSQLDYLLNLAEQIKQLDKHYAHEGGIKAIGITGSDTYDKLLILQGLRKKFPGVLFFTTDLDARFFHPSEIKSTRNLLVASPFGLQLNEDFQKKTPPFRENYQTSLYLATQLALCKGEIDKKNDECNSGIFVADSKEWIEKARLFEIGNDGPVNISHENNKFLDAQASDRSKIVYVDNKLRDYYIITVVVMLILLSLLFRFFFTPKSYHITLFGATSVSVVMILFVCSLFEFYSGVELVSFSNGTSMWPSVIMKILAIFLSIYCFYRIHEKMLEDRKNVDQNYLKFDKDAELEESLWKELSKFRDELFLWKDEAKEALAMFRASLSDYKSRDRLKKNLSIDGWGKSYSQKMHFSRLWSEYLDLSKWRFALLRIIPALVITVFIFWLAIIVFGDVSFHHIRGQSNDTWNLISLGLAVLFYLSLILYIADKVHVSSHFIKLLANPKIEIDWPDDVKKTYQNKYGLPEEVVKNRILLDFINDHASIPNKFIYYPFFCLFLIIFSRNYYFDNWPTTPFVYSVYVFFAFLTLASAFRLRDAALYAREQILEKLVNNSRHAPVNAKWHKRNDNSAKLKSFIDEIRVFKEGVYSPLAMILNSLVPSSSIGGIYLIEYLF